MRKVLYATLLFTLAAMPVLAQAGPDRTVLPIPEPSYPPITELDARNVTPPPSRGGPLACRGSKRP
jgi:hypothetical protein